MFLVTVLLLTARHRDLRSRELQGDFSSGSELDLNKNTTTVKYPNRDPADSNECDGIEQRGKGLVWNDMQHRAVKNLLEVYARMGMYAAEG